MSVELKPCKHLRITPFRVCMKYTEKGGKLALCYLGITENECKDYEPKIELNGKSGGQDERPDKA